MDDQGVCGCVCVQMGWRGKSGEGGGYRVSFKEDGSWDAG